MLDRPTHCPKIKPPKKGEFKLDLGCGDGRKKKGFIGIDIIKFKGVDYVCDLTKDWPIADSIVDEVHMSHLIEHMSSPERVHFCNELYRVMKNEAKALFVLPHWSNCRAYGDPTHQWPPISEFFFYYLSQKWRDMEAPHTDIKHWPGGFFCDFECTWGYSVVPPINTRSQEFQNFAVSHYKDAIYDIHVTLIKRVMPELER